MAPNQVLTDVRSTPAPRSANAAQEPTALRLSLVGEDTGNRAQGHVTSEELQRQGYSRSEADRIAARQNADANLVRSFLRFFRLWTSFFLLLCIPTLCFLFMVLFSYSQFKKIPCVAVFRVWTEVVIFMAIYFLLIHRFVVQKICCYQPDEDAIHPQAAPFRIKVLVVFRAVCSAGWGVAGLAFASNRKQCDPQAQQSYDDFANSIFYFSLFFLFLNAHFCVLFTGPFILLRYAQRQGWLHGPEGAPKGTASQLPTVDYKGDEAFALVRDDGCTICLDEFHLKGNVIKRTHCGHYFHLECIESWLQVSRCCPLCRFDIADGLDPKTKVANGGETA